jgi:hypothetical protein
VQDLCGDALQSSIAGLAVVLTWLGFAMVAACLHCGASDDVLETARARVPQEVEAH